MISENIFGTVLGGSHPEVKEETERILHHALVNKVSVRIDYFYHTENLGIECNPKCGACKCAKCHVGGKEMSIQDEREMKMIESNMSYVKQ